MGVPPGFNGIQYSTVQFREPHHYKYSAYPQLQEKMVSKSLSVVPAPPGPIYYFTSCQDLQ